MFRSLLGSLSFMIWLLMTISSVQAQNQPVLDTAGNTLEAGVQYYIRPAITDFGGAFTLILRNGACPYYVGQEFTYSTTSSQSSLSESIVPVISGPVPVIFTPFEEGETVIRESRDVKFVFSTLTVCPESTSWNLNGVDETTGRRLLSTGEDDWQYPTGNYFRIKGTESEKVYTLEWCPAEVCPICKFACEDNHVGPSLIENGERLAALNGSFALPVVFQKK
ncbi:kunitz type trypsin inhibitor 104-like [Ziziphus jujuba]|uniref:Kunitz type trypsin inhibitor 104-like n=1 Tax=Ziziphus jujuba TaxID=326968 RepID=A0ABM3ZVK4_ZIZJJ|nr:kunitz type trypsin inhibitor 104-like [Ziziphus jujuba]